MVGLGQIIHDAVATVDTVITDLLATVTHAPFASRDGYGKATYGTGVSRRAVVSYRQSKVIKPDGTESVSQTQVILLGNIAVLIDDRFTLPDGTTPPIMAISKVLDKSGNPYAVKVFF